MVAHLYRPPSYLFLTLLYLLVGALTLGLLSPVLMAWLLGRIEWRRTGLSLLFSLPFWALAVWKPSAAAGLLWLAALAVAHAWQGRFWRGIWLPSLALSLAHFLLWSGLLLGFLLLTPFKDPITPWLAGGLLLAALFLVEGSMQIMRRYCALFA